MKTKHPTRPTVARTQKAARAMIRASFRKHGSYPVRPTAAQVDAVVDQMWACIQTVRKHFPDLVFVIQDWRKQNDYQIFCWRAVARWHLRNGGRP